MRPRGGSGSFRPLIVSAGSFQPGSFRPILGVGCFGLDRWVVSALSCFGPESFRPSFNMVGYKHGFVKMDRRTDERIDR